MRGNFKNIEHCRICGSTELSVAMTLPPQFLSPTFVETNIGNELSDIKVAMTMLVCGNSECAFVQLKETTKPELLYTDYFYRTATNDTMKKDLKYVVDTTLERCPLNKGDIIVDIGANDCTMVRWFPENVRRIAIEPAKNIDWHHIPDEIEIVNDFFPSTAAADKLNGHKIKIFTSCAMFYDVDDPNAFVRAVKFYLHADGIWCLQVSYNLLMIKNANFYDICHEHLGFYTLKSLGYLFSRHGLKIHHAETRSVHGGSSLVFVKHESAIDGQSGNVKDLLTEEKEMGLYEVGTYIDLYKKMEALRSNVTEYITNEITNKRLVLGLGASTKGNVLLQNMMKLKDGADKILKTEPVM